MSSITLTHFYELSSTQKELVLLWRNHEDIRKWMVNSGPIGGEEHLAFIETLRDSSHKLYFLVHYNGKSYGVVYLTHINTDAHSAELGIYANPDLHGVGKILMRALIDYVKTLNIKLLIADVFNDNKRAKHLYKIFDFKETKRFLQHKKEFIRMELFL